MGSKAKIKICIITSAHPAKDNRIFFKEALTLKENGYEICLIAPGNKDIIEDGIRIYSIPIFTNWFGRVKNQYRIFQKIKRIKASVYHLHDPDLLILGVITEWLLRKKVIYDAHEDLPLALSSSRDYIPKKLRKFIPAVIDFIERICAKRLSGVIAVYEHRMKKIAHKKKPFVLLPNYPKASFFPSVDFTKKDNRKMIYIGGISEARGMMVMLDLMKELRHRSSDLSLELIGPFFTHKQKESFFTKLKKEDLNNISYRPQVSYKEIPELLTAASIGLIPWLPTEQHLHAANPTKMFEYMAAGIVSVAGDYGIFHDVFSDNIAGALYSPFDIQQMADTVTQLSGNESLLLERMKSAREMFEQKYNWEILSTSFLNFYDSVISR